MADILMYIPNDDTQKHHFCKLQSVIETLNELTIQNPIKVCKFVKSTYKKMLL